MWLETNPTLEQEPVLISNLIGKRMKTRGARHRKLEVFFFNSRSSSCASLVSCAFLCSHEKLKKKKKKKRRLFHWVNGFFLRHGLGWHTTLSKVYRELRKNFQVGKMVNLSSSCLCLILFTNMTLIVIVWLYASRICIDLMITHRRVSVAQR